MSIATDLQAVHTGLQGVLDDCNTALVSKGGASVSALAALAAAISGLPSGSIELPTLNNPAADNDVAEGKEYIDQNGEKRTGTQTAALPSWISECEIQTFTPTEDTQEDQVFSFNTLTKAPHIFVVSCNGVFGSYAQLDLLAASSFCFHAGGSVHARGTYQVYARGPSAPINATGTVSVDGTTVTVTPPAYGSYGKAYWRSKYTYTAVALSLSFGGASE